MKAIVAMDEAGGIGYKGGLPWPKIKEDLKWFKEFTAGQEIIVGRKTFDSLPKLEGRKIRVLTRNEINLTSIGSNSFGYISLASLPSNSIVCGGAEIYKLLVPKCDELYITHVKGKYDADTYFPFSPKKIEEMFPWIQVIKRLKNGHVIVRHFKGKKVTLEDVIKKFEESEKPFYEAMEMLRKLKEGTN